MIIQSREEQQGCATTQQRINSAANLATDDNDWCSAHLPIGAPSVFGAEVFRNEGSWIAWRGPSGKYLFGLGGDSCKTFENLQAAERAIKDNPPTAPISFFGARFDHQFATKQAHWSDWPNVEIRSPKIIIQWSGASDAAPKVWFKRKYRTKALALGQKFRKRTDSSISESSKTLWRPLENETEWASRINESKNGFESRVLDKVVLARAIESSLSIDDALVYSVIDNLWQSRTRDTCFAWKQKDNLFLGLTPETLVENQNGQIRTHALAGTMARDESEADFLKNEKTQREHLAVIEQIESQLRPICEELRTHETEILTTGTLKHLETKIEARMIGGHLMSLVSKLHPTPALGGFPRDAAMTWIQTHEAMDRGWFGGPLGWFEQNGSGVAAVAIRCALISKKGSFAYAGAGIVEGSSPTLEWAETNQKFSTILKFFNGQIV